MDKRKVTKWHEPPSGTQASDTTRVKRHRARATRQDPAAQGRLTRRSDTALGADTQGEAQAADKPKRQSQQVDPGAQGTRVD